MRKRPRRASSDVDRQSETAKELDVTVKTVQLLDHSPISRLTRINDLAAHPFFENYSIEATAERRIHPFDYIPRQFLMPSLRKRLRAGF